MHKTSPSEWRTIATETANSPSRGKSAIWRSTHAFVDGELVALLGWASAALRNGPRDRYVGWDDHGRTANLHMVVNNSRFLVLPWGQRPNLASRVLAANLRRLSGDWQQRYGHAVVLAESFVDTARFAGTCYRASNWICMGHS